MERSKRSIQYTPYEIIVAIHILDGHIDVARKKYVECKDSAYQNAYFCDILIVKSSRGRREVFSDG